MKNKSSNAFTLIICILNFLTVLVPLITKIYDRKQVIKAVDNDEMITLLTNRKKTTEIVK